MAFWNRGRGASRIDIEDRVNYGGGGDSTDVADRCCFVDVDGQGCVEIVVVGPVHVDCVAWGECLRDCRVGDGGIGYGYCVRVGVVGCRGCGCGDRGGCGRVRYSSGRIGGCSGGRRRERWCCSRCCGCRD